MKKKHVVSKKIEPIGMIVKFWFSELNVKKQILQALSCRTVDKKNNFVPSEQKKTSSALMFWTQRRKLMTGWLHSGTKAQHSTRYLLSDPPGSN